MTLTAALAEPDLALVPEGYLTACRLDPLRSEPKLVMLLRPWLDFAEYAP